MNIKQTTDSRPDKARGHAFTLPEVMLAVVIMMLVFDGVIKAYIQFDRRMEWSGYSLEAQALSIRQLEEARAAKWDTQANPPIDNVTNLPNLTWTNLDIPISGTNMIYATNILTATNITINAANAAMVRFIRVDTYWQFKGTTYTNTIATYRAPDQ
jgi:Tfp pilus assembly protein PilV